MTNKKVFGFGLMDYVLIVPNAIGVFLGAAQMLLRMIMPSKTSAQDSASEVEKGAELSINREDWENELSFVIMIYRSSLSGHICMCFWEQFEGTSIYLRNIVSSIVTTMFSIILKIYRSRQLTLSHKCTKLSPCYRWRAGKMKWMKKSTVNCIHWVLPTTPAYEATRSMRQYLLRELERTEHFRSEHYMILKKAIYYDAA